MTTADYEAARRRLAKWNPVGGEAPRPVTERTILHDPLATSQAEARHSGKYVVRVTSYRTRLLDEDNLAEKFHVDTCRYAGLIPSDAPDQTTITVSQVKVKTKEECRTEIEIERLT